MSDVRLSQALNDPEWWVVHYSVGTTAIDFIFLVYSSNFYGDCEAHNELLYSKYVNKSSKSKLRVFAKPMI